MTGKITKQELHSSVNDILNNVGELETTVESLESDMQDQTNELNQHKNDKNNPHEVTTEQIGAAKASDVGDISTVPTTAKNAAGAITEIYRDVEEVNQTVAAHIADSVQEDEVHGMRVSDGQFQFFNGSKWEGIKSGVEATTKIITYYVSPTGSDSNDGLTAQTAFRTIGHAISLIPQIVNHNVYIRPEPGTYDEAVRLTGYIGSGRISVLGSSTLGKTHNVKLIDIKKCSCDIEVRGFNITQATNGTFEISISGCSSVFLTYIYSDIVSSHGIDFVNSFGHISDSLISNKTGTGIRASNFSTLGSYRNTGNNNGVALSSVTVSTIGKLGSQPSGTTAEGTATGGVIR